MQIDDRIWSDLLEKIKRIIHGDLAVDFTVDGASDLSGLTTLLSDWQANDQELLLYMAAINLELRNGLMSLAGSEKNPEIERLVQKINAFDQTLRQIKFFQVTYDGQHIGAAEDHPNPFSDRMIESEGGVQ
jgi:hypothetical protein